MNLRWPFSRKPDDTAALRDELLAGNTRLSGREAMVSRPKPVREIRCDAKSYQDAKVRTTDRLRSEMAAQHNLSLEEAIEKGRAA